MKNLPALIGVVHLPALAGAPESLRRGESPSQALQRAGLRAVAETRVLEKAGFQGIILENFGDVPFYRDRVPAETVASMAVIAAAVRESTRLPIGINVLRNDALSALAIAAVCGCDFIRVNVLSGVAATDQGFIEGQAAALLRERARLGADPAGDSGGIRGIYILADVHVKHARSLSSPGGPQGLELAIEESALRAGADAVILTGATTGREADAEELAIAAETCCRHGLAWYVGSGINLRNIAAIRALPAAPGLSVGCMIGSALRKGGLAGAPLNPAAVTALARAFAGKRSPSKGKSQR